MKSIVLVLFLAGASLMQALCQAPTENGRLNGKADANKQSQVIVQLSQGTDPVRFTAQYNASCLQADRISLVKTLSLSQGIHLFETLATGDKGRLLKILQAKRGVVSASWNAPVQFRNTEPNDPLFSQQWDMKRIGLPSVWDLSTGGLTASGREIVVAVLDKGFDLSHPEFVGNIWQNPGEIPGDGQDNDGNGLPDDVTGWNFRQNSPINPVEHHGTWVTGIIGAKGGNGDGIAGINWDIKMMFLAVEYVDEIVSALDYILQMRQLYNETNGAKGAFVVVTNGSFGIDGVRCEEEPAWGSMYDPLGEMGVLSVAATANIDWDVEVKGDIPTTCTSEFLVTVTSTDSSDQRAIDAAYGKVSIDLAAPGVPTLTTNILGEYREGFSGTSSACPHVAGAVALLYSLPCTAIDSLAMANPSAAALLMRDAVLLGVDKIYNLADETASGGRLNVYGAMKHIHSFCISTDKERSEGIFAETYIGLRDIVRISPNPVQDELKITYRITDFRDMQIRIFNMLGQEVRYPLPVEPAPFEEQEVSLDVSGWPSGTYFINIFDNTRDITAKFVKI